MQTKIWLRDDALLIIGIDIALILPAFSDQDLIWYTKLYGQFDDDVSLFAVTPTVAINNPNTLHLPDESLTERFNIPDSIKEYQLTAAVQQNLAITFINECYHANNNELIKYKIYCHDNFFNVIEPFDNQLIRKILNNILNHHSTEFNRLICWHNSLEKILELLYLKRTICVENKHKQQQVLIKYGERRFADKLLGKKLFKINVCDSDAVIEQIVD